MEFIEIKPLKPFCGSYPCALADADQIDEALHEADGVITKRQVPRKKFFGLIAVERMASHHEIALIEAGQAPHITVVSKTKDECHVIVHPVPLTVSVPADMATNLVARGLAERVATNAKRGK